MSSRVLTDSGLAMKRNVVLLSLVAFSLVVLMAVGFGSTILGARLDPVETFGSFSDFAATYDQTDIIGEFGLTHPFLFRLHLTPGISY